MQNASAKNTTLFLAVAAMYVAVITGGKQALSIIPNVEIVSILLATCGYVWGLAMALPVAVVFTAVQMAFYGFNMWVFEYFVYWPLLAACFCLLGKAKFRNAVVQTVAATSLVVVLTLFFGVFTSATDTLIGYTAEGFKVATDDFGYRFSAMYVRGIPFFATHVISNAVFFAVGFHPLVRITEKMKLRLFA